MAFDLRQGLLAVLLLTAATASWWFLQHITEPAPSLTADENESREPSYYIENFETTVMNEGGQRKYTLIADTMQHYEYNETLRLDKPHLIRYKVGRVPIHARADLAWFDDNKKEILMTGNVKITRTGSSTDQNSEMSTPKLRILLD
jgi:LPS export ABC transporter protein LptC